MKKIFIVAGFLSYTFVFGQTEESVKSYFQKDKYLSEYVNRMYKKDAENKSAIGKLYNENIKTLKSEELNESFCNATKLAKFYTDRCVFKGEGVDRLKDVDNLINKHLKNKDVYKTNNLGQLNGLMYLACFNNSCFSKSEKGEYQLSKEKVKKIVTEKLKEAAADKSKETFKAIKHCSSEIEKNSELSVYLKEQNAIDENKSIDKNIRALALLITYDVVWYLEKFEAATLYDKLDKEIEDQFHTTPLQNIDGKTCYFNAAMQALYASKRFKNFIKDEANKVEELQCKIKAYQKTADARQNTRTELKKKIKEDDEEINELKEKIEDYENTVDELKNKRKQIKKEVNSNESEHNEYYKKIQEAIDEKNKLIDEAEKIRKYYNNEIESFKIPGQNNYKQPEGTKKAQFEILETTYSSKENQIKLYEERIMGHKKFMNELAQKVEKGKSEYQELQKKLNGPEKALEALQNKLKEQEKNRKNHKEELNQLIEEEKKYKEYLKKFKELTTTNKANPKQNDLFKALNDLFCEMQCSTASSLDKNTIDGYIQKMFECSLGGEFDDQLRPKTKTEYTYQQSDATELIIGILNKLAERFASETEFISNITFTSSPNMNYFLPSQHNDISTVEKLIEKDLAEDEETKKKGDSFKILPEVFIVVNLARNDVSCQPELVLKENDGTKVKYKLVSVITRSENPKYFAANGHYWTYTKGRKGKWFNINDEKSHDITNQIFDKEFNSKKRNGEDYNHRKHMAFIYDKVSE